MAKNIVPLNTFMTAPAPTSCVRIAGDTAVKPAVNSASAVRAYATNVKSRTSQFSPDANHDETQSGKKGDNGSYRR